MKMMSTNRPQFNMYASVIVESLWAQGPGDSCGLICHPKPFPTPRDTLVVACWMRSSLLSVPHGATVTWFGVRF